MPATACAILLLSLLAPGPAAAGPAPRPITLEQAIWEGLDRSPAVAASRANLDASEADQARARAARWPRVTAEAGWHSTDHQVTVFSDKLTSGRFTADDFALESLNDPDPISHTMAAVTVQLPLYTFGRIESGVSSTGHLQEASRASLAAVEADLTESITAGYFAIPRARAAVAVAEAGLADAQGHEATALARFEAGAALRSDHLRARVRRLARESDLLRRVSELEMARARLRELLSLPSGDAVEPATDLAEPPAGPGALADWLSRAADSRPELAASRAFVASAEDAVAGARATMRPELSGLARYERNTDRLDAGQGAYLVGLSLSWSAFDATLSPAITRADARARAARAAHLSLESDIRLQVERAWREVTVADRALAVAREAVGAAQTARAITSDRYAAGLLPITDLLDTETELVATRMDELAALYEAVVSRARLQRAVGPGEIR
ncbi:MAG TPA: TolC family protein [Candidatus Polarisedimenticolia bacterium]|nr:TolC family protein [Candidatus Polarisedimenticolia bacterium]